MTGAFNYYYQEQPTDTLEIEDVGNCCIEANDDLGNFYYLCIKTAFGFTRTLEYGPVMDPMVPTMLTCDFNQFEYNEKKLSKIINKFLNNPASGITQAQVIEMDMFTPKFVSPLDVFMN